MSNFYQYFSYVMTFTLSNSLNIAFDKNLIIVYVGMILSCISNLLMVFKKI